MLAASIHSALGRAGLVLMLSASVFGIFAGWYYWIGKMCGRQYPEWAGKLHFWLTFIGASAMTRLRLDFAVTMLTERLSPRHQKFAKVISTGLVVVFGIALTVTCVLWMDPVGLARAGFDGRKLAAETEGSMDEMDFLQDFVAIPVLTLVRFGRWDAVLGEPRPDERHGYLVGISHYARGLAHTRRGELELAAKELEALREVADSEAMRSLMLAGGTATASALLDIGVSHLDGEILLANGNAPAAIAACTAATAAAATGAVGRLLTQAALRTTAPTSTRPSAATTTQSSATGRPSSSARFQSACTSCAPRRLPWGPASLPCLSTASARCCALRWACVTSASSLCRSRTPTLARRAPRRRALRHGWGRRK